MNESPNFLTCPIAPELPSAQYESREELPSEAPREKAPRPRRKWKRWVLGACVGIVLALLIPALYELGQAGLAAQRAKYSLGRVESAVRILQFETAKAHTREARDELQTARLHLRKVGVWRDLPWTGTQIRGLEDAVSAGIGTLDSAEELLEIARTLTDVMKGSTSLVGGLSSGVDPTRRFVDLTREEKREILRRFQSELPRLRLARDKMDLASELWLRIPQSDLARPIRFALEPLANAIPVLAESLDNAVPLIEVLLPLAGYPEPRRFVILLQNADEIRPAGGFIGNIGTVRMEGGELTEFDFQDVYAIDNPVSAVWNEEPPEPLRRWLGLQKWFMRDANWSPDFPTSAERVLDFYIREVELQAHAPLTHRPDTIVALEPGFFEALLELTGPITSDGITFDKDNFFDQIQYEVEVHFHQQGIPTEQRKDIVGRIGAQLMEKLLTLPVSEWPRFLAVAREAFDRKDIMMYSRDPAFLTLLDARDWTGRTTPTDGDFLWVVDANIAALKTDGAMEKRIRYAIDTTDPAGPVGKVTLTYANTAPGYTDFRYTRYRSYTRVYVPEGSVLLESHGAMKNDLGATKGVFVPGDVDVFRELGKSVFGAFWSVDPGKTGTLEFTYRLPESVASRVRDGAYRLDVQKQPGVDDAEVIVDAAFVSAVDSADPPEDTDLWGDAAYHIETTTLRDRSFSVELQ